jgi:tight adherence protein B
MGAALMLSQQIFISLLLALSVALVGSIAVLLSKERRKLLQQQLHVQTESTLWEFLSRASARQVWIVSAVFMLPLVGVVAAFTSLFWAAAAALGCLAVVPMVRNQLLSRRQRQVTLQLPDALTLLSHAMASGMSLLPALELSLSQCPQPLKGELSLMLQRLRLGESLSSALAALATRIPTMAIQFFVLTMQIGARHGGQQVAVLQRMAKALQQQNIAQQRLLSLSAQARLQGRVMLLLPIGLFMVLRWLHPDNTALLTQTREGWAILSVSALLLLVGNLLVRRIMQSAADA